METAKTIEPDRYVPYAMTQAQYLREVIVIRVEPQAFRGSLSLVCADEASQAALDDLHRVISTQVPGVADRAQDRAAEVIRNLLSTNFDRDAWCSSDFSLPPVVMIKQGVLEGRMSQDDAIRRLHEAIVLEALQESLPVPSAVLEDYRQRFGAAAVAREVF